MAARYSEVARLMRRTPAAVSSATREGFAAESPTMKLTGLLTDAHTVRTAARVGQRGREQHVGAGLFEGLQAADGVVEIGAAVAGNSRRAP